MQAEHILLESQDMQFYGQIILVEHMPVVLLKV